jgi:hypothetical protein
MAKQTVITLTDDIDGTEASESVEFGIDGYLYTVDLSADHAEELRDPIATATPPSAPGLRPTGST